MDLLLIGRFFNVQEREQVPNRTLAAPVVSVHGVLPPIMLRWVLGNAVICQLVAVAIRTH